MRTLAIDFGTRRVGLAMSDEGGQFATPLDVLEITSPQQATEQILSIVQRESVKRLVVGLPLNMDDSMGSGLRGQRLCGRNSLASKADLPLIFVDERLSSFDAEQRLIERKRGGEKITRRQKKERLDALAAAGFLQAFLDGKLNAVVIREA